MEIISAKDMRVITEAHARNLAEEVLAEWFQAITEAAEDNEYHVVIPRNWRMNDKLIEAKVIKTMRDAGYVIWTMLRDTNIYYGIHWHEDVNYGSKIIYG